MSQSNDQKAVRTKQTEAIELINICGWSIDRPETYGSRFYDVESAFRLLINVNWDKVHASVDAAFDPDNIEMEGAEFGPPRGDSRRVLNDTQIKESEVWHYYGWVQQLYLDDHDEVAEHYERDSCFDNVPTVKAERFANWAAGKGFKVPFCFPLPEGVEVAKATKLGGERTGAAKDFIQSLLAAYRLDFEANGVETLAVMLKWAKGKSIENYKNLDHDKDKVFDDHGFSVWKNSLRSALKQLKNND